MNTKPHPIRRWLSFTLAIILVVSLFSAGNFHVYGNSEGPVEIQDLVISKDESAYEGYIFKLKEDVSISRVQTLDKKEEKDEHIEKLEYVDKTYTAESLDAIDDFVPLELVEYVEPDYQVELHDSNVMSATEPNDEYYDMQWNLDMVSASAIWEYGLEGQAVESEDREVVVAVIDSGIKFDHEDFNWDLIKEGKNFNGANKTTNDTFGHGTFVSGLIAAQKDNSVGIAGIAPQVSILPVRVFVEERTSTSIIVQAVNYAIDQEVDVINMSLGSNASSATLQNACDNAAAEGILLVASAGNDGNYNPSYPAQYDSVVGVGSVDENRECSYFSQLGTERVFVTAPGENVVSTYYESERSYRRASGTSFSAPKVSALAAIVKSVDPSVTMAEFKQLLISTSKDIGSPGRDVQFGYGLIDFKAVAKSLLNPDDPTATSAVKFEFYDRLDQPIYKADINLEKIKAEGNEPVTVNSDGTCSLAYGPYSYRVEASGYDPVEASFAVYTNSRTIKVVMDTISYRAEMKVVDTSGQDITSEASIEIRTEDGRRVAKIEKEGPDKGKFAVRAGKYHYTAKANNYYTGSGSFAITDSSVQIPVTLLGDNDLAHVSFKVIDGQGAPLNKATVHMTQDNKDVIAFSDGTHKLLPGTYNYTASVKKYKDESGTVVIQDQDKGTSKVVEVKMETPIVRVVIEPTPIKATVEVYDSGNNLQSQTGTNIYDLVPGNYTYKVSMNGYVTKTGTFSVVTNTEFITVDLDKDKDSSGGNSGGNPGSTVKPDPDDEDPPVVITTGGSLTAEEIDEIMGQFSDVKKTWYYDDVALSVHRGYFEGTSKTTFSPDTVMTRGMIVKTVASMSGEDISSYTTQFYDVKSNLWYTKAVGWAAKKGIVKGVGNNKFNPDGKVTRQEIANIMYEYAKYKGYDVKISAQDDIAKMKDLDSIASWAKDAFLWAYDKEIIKGLDDSTLRPKDNATRAEVAAIIIRFDNNYYEVKK